MTFKMTITLTNILFTHSYDNEYDNKNGYNFITNME